MVSAVQQRVRYIVGDLLSSVLAWTAFNYIRFYNGGRALYDFPSLESYLTSEVVLIGEVAFPVMMLGVYALSGFYNEVFRKSHVQNLVTTFISSLANTLLIFFIALINDVILEQRGTNYELVLLLLVLQFSFVFLSRFLITKYSNGKIYSGEWAYNVLIVGTADKAVAFERQLSNKDYYLGYNAVGYVDVGEKQAVISQSSLPIYGLENIGEVCNRLNVKELIVIPSSSDIISSLDIINKLYILGLPIKVSPDTYTILVGKMRLSNLRGEPLVDISSCGMSEFEKNVKRLSDVLVSALALVVLSPFLLLIGAIVKLDSRGSAIYKQVRVGYRNKLFTIYKFRTMVENAENEGMPALSSVNDKRITRVGQILRKYRLDELPQFWNVLVGEMSLVGPRPERKYFVDLIVKEAPLYSLLHQVRPGLTSMGMVKYGYASSVEEMVERFRYDLLYLENMSITNDIKILIYTVKIVFTGKGI